MAKIKLLYLFVVMIFIFPLFIGCGGGATPSGGTSSPTPTTLASPTPNPSVTPSPSPTNIMATVTPAPPFEPTATCSPTPTAVPTPTPTPSGPRTIYVPGNYATIQAAINTANDGDTIIVSAGTYIENLMISKPIVLRSADPTHPELTVINAGANGKDGIRIENADVTVRGFTITNVVGNTTSYGKAIFIFGGAATIDGNTIELNKTESAAIYFQDINNNDDSPLIINNIIRNNEYYTAGINGGSGIYLSGGSPQIKNNTITGNKSSYGGGIRVNNSNAMIEGNTISGNYAYEDGGGIDVHGLSVVIKNNIITGNHAGGEGGGINLFQSSARVFGNTITHNIADNTSIKGGGILVGYQALILDQYGNPWPASDQSGLNGSYQNNTFSDNQPNDVEFY